MEQCLELSLTRALSEIHRVVKAVEEFSDLHQLPVRSCHSLILALDELLTNTISYTDDSVALQIKLRIELHGQRLMAVIEDNGPEFNPLNDTSEPDLEAFLDDRAIGGLGVHLVKTLMSEVHYQRLHLDSGERNQVTLVLNVLPLAVGETP